MRVPLRITPQRVLQRFILIAFVTATVNAALPTELDPFLERLFDTVECEPFLAEAKYFSVATTECHPYTCNFPVQMCMREAAKFQDESANQCINLPTDCLTAANGGIPVSSGAPHIVTTPPPRVFGGIAPGVGGVNPADRINGNGRPPVRLVTASPNSPNPGPPPPPERFLPRNGPNAHGDICQQGVPEGRFCGFQLKFTYNKETGNCEQFWFPGCATEATNDNLFGGEQDCKVATSHCSAPAPAVTERPIRIRKPTTAAPPNPTTTTTSSPFPDYPDSGEVPQPPPPPENRGGGGFGGRGGGGGVDLGSLAGSFMGGGGGGPGGIVGQLLGSGLGGGGGGGSKSSVVPSGYGGNSLGGGDGGSSGGGQPNFIGLIANAVQQVSNKPDGGAAGGAPAAAQWLKNIDAAVDDLSLLQKQDASQLCRMERDVGHRDCATIGWHHRFYFDFASGDCRAFWYLGCGGNLNNFKQLSHCKAICLNKRV